MLVRNEENLMKELNIQTEEVNAIKGDLSMKMSALFPPMEKCILNNFQRFYYRFANNVNINKFADNNVFFFNLILSS